MEIVGGNQAGTVKITKIPFSVGDPRLRISTVRRKWVSPDTPLPTSSSAKGISTGALGSPVSPDLLKTQPIKLSASKNSN
jgi:hypothetical protein